LSRKKQQEDWDSNKASNGVAKGERKKEKER